MAYSVFQADIKKHKEMLISLWKRNFDWIPEERYQWIYENNPNGYPITYLLNHENNKSIVGAISLFPRTMYIDGEPARSLICGDLVVDKKHRALGPAMTMLKAAVSRCKKDGYSIMLGFPNKLAEPVMHRAGFVTLDHIFEMTHVIRAYPFLFRHINNSMISHLLAIPIDMSYRLRSESFINSSGAYNIEVMNLFDDKFNDLWKYLEKNFTFLGERNDKFLNWRYRYSPYAKYQIFLLSKIDKKNDPLGYIVYHRQEKRIQIVDMAFNGATKYLNDLIASFSKHQRSRGINSIAISLAGNNDILKVFKKRCYSIRDESMRVVLYVPTQKKDILTIIKNGNWYLTSADNDI